MRGFDHPIDRRDAGFPERSGGFEPGRPLGSEADSAPGARIPAWVRAPVAALALVVAGPASAEGWTFAVSPYLWLPGISTSTEIDGRTLDADLSPSDAVASLDFAFMGAVEARNGRWGLILDTVYADLGAEESTPFGQLWSEAEVDTRLSATTIYAGYRVAESEKGSVDLLAGARFYDLDMTLSLAPGLREARSRAISDTWVNPVLGVRGRYAFTERWFASGVADFGGFAGETSSWQLFGSLGYQFNPNWSVQGGWRYLDIDHEINNSDVGIALSGPILGVTFRF